MEWFLEKGLVWSVPGSGWRNISEAGSKDVFWEHSLPLFAIGAVFPLLYKERLQRVLLTRCKQEKCMEEQSVCFYSLF